MQACAFEALTADVPGLPPCDNKNSISQAYVAQAGLMQ